MLPPFIPTFDRLRPLCTASLLLAAGVPPADLRRAAGMCPELLSMPVETITAALRFLTEEAGVPAEDLPRVLRWRPGSGRRSAECVVEEEETGRESSVAAVECALLSVSSPLPPGFVGSSPSCSNDLSNPYINCNGWFGLLFRLLYDSEFPIPYARLTGEWQALE